MCDGEPGKGAQKTVEFAEKHGKSYLLLDSNNDSELLIDAIVSWIEALSYPKVILNVAGSRGSQAPNLQAIFAVEYIDDFGDTAYILKWIEKDELVDI
ncbi:MAG: putative molybdenum carrier protein [Victivallaceae bacterium]|nr:putative molybdenum carrier protein [Victivallaceae bacterium]